ncbi:MAG: hypothetical protein R6V83_07990 [Candidatus Thorarchaeota archaeon]
MALRKSTKYAIAGVVLVLLGLLLNQLLIWLYYWTVLNDYGDTPPPVATMSGSVFLLLIPVGIVLILYAIYLRLEESKSDVS